MKNRNIQNEQKTRSAIGRATKNKSAADKLLSASDIAEELGLSWKSAKKLMLEYMAYIEIGGCVFVSEGAFETYLIARTIPTGPAKVPAFSQPDSRPSLIPDVIAQLAPILFEVPVMKYPPGIYFLIKNNEVVYVGQSIVVAGRVSQHVKEKDFDSAVCIQVPRERLTETERAFIRALKPKLNGSGTTQELNDYDRQVLADLGLKIGKER